MPFTARIHKPIKDTPYALWSPADGQYLKSNKDQIDCSVVPGYSFHSFRIFKDWWLSKLLECSQFCEDIMRELNIFYHFFHDIRLSLTLAQLIQKYFLIIMTLSSLIAADNTFIILNTCHLCPFTYHSMDIIFPALELSAVFEHSQARALNRKLAFKKKKTPRFISSIALVLTRFTLSAFKIFFHLTY